MGMLEDMKALAVEGQPQPRAHRTRDGSICSVAQIKASPCQQGDSSPCAEIVESQVQLPEDILYLIHAIMPMRDAARASCVSPGFLRSWRCYPKLILTIDSLGIKKGASRKDEMTRDFISRVDHIMQNHSGMGVKSFKLQTYPCSDLHASYVDHWLQLAITPGIQEFELSISESGDIKYDFPCSFLSSERIASIQKFVLAGCSFHSAAQFGCLISLTNLDLRSVHITGEELCSFLSNSCALKQFYVSFCNNIICLKIPSLLQQHSILIVLDCSKLVVIDSKAPM